MLLSERSERAKKKRMIMHLGVNGKIIIACGHTRCYSFPRSTRGFAGTSLQSEGMASHGYIGCRRFGSSTTPPPLGYVAVRDLVAVLLEVLMDSVVQGLLKVPDRLPPSLKLAEVLSCQLRLSIPPGFRS